MSDILSAKLTELIEIRTVKGTGETEDPVRTAIQYWSLEGKLLFEVD